MSAHLRAAWRHLASSIRYEVSEKGDLQRGDLTAWVWAYDGATAVGVIKAHYHFGYFRHGLAIEGEVWSVWSVEVAETHRRQGIARQMFEELRAAYPEHTIVHGGFISDEGRAMAESFRGTPGHAIIASRAAGPAQLSALVDTFAARLPEMADPMSADGMCIAIEFQFRTFLEQAAAPGGYRSVYVEGPTRMSPARIEYLAYYGDRPERMTHTVSSVRLGGEWWVVDFTYAQFDETAPWPLVEREAEYLTRFTTHRYFNERISARTARRFFHVTDNPGFVIDLTYEPEDVYANDGAGGTTGEPGLFVTDDAGRWGARGSYVVELEVDDSSSTFEDETIWDDYQREWLLRPEHLQRARVVGVTPRVAKTAMPQSWRPLGDTPYYTEHDAVIVTDTGGGRRRHFEVFTYGIAFASYLSLAEAKAGLEAVYGPLPWRRVLLPKEQAVHYYFGPTTEFSDPVTIYVTPLPALA